jgi:hypothetical protein
MKRNFALLIGLVMLLASTGLFAEGRQERANDNDETMEPAITASLQVAGNKDLSSADLAAQYADQIISLVDAENLVRQANPDQMILGISLENQNGYIIYEAALADGSAVLLDAANGEVVLHEKKADLEHEREKESAEDNDREDSEGGGEED